MRELHPIEELPKIVEYLHSHNVKGFLTFNTLIFSDELPAAVDYIRAIATSGIDAVIVQDLGLARLIQRMAPTLPIHGSTQMTLTEPRGIEFVRQFGVKRVVLARELSTTDIRKITAGTSMPLEVFIHGALLPSPIPANASPAKPSAAAAPTAANAPKPAASPTNSSSTAK